MRFEERLSIGSASAGVCRMARYDERKTPRTMRVSAEAKVIG